MRSTVIIGDEIFRRVRRRAAELQVTVSDVINDALRLMLAQQPVDAPPMKLLAFGDAKQAVHHEPADFATAVADDDSQRIDH